MNKGNKLYVYVGEHKTSRNTSSFNGALGSSNDGASAGGATDIRLSSTENWYDFNSLKNRIMVAAGGGSSSTNPSYPGASAGGLVGYRAIGASGQCSYPGTQISPGTEECWGNYQPGKFSNGSFGLGSRYGASGGSGWFGGAGGYNKYGGGSGGSSFISGHPGCVSITEDSTEDNISFINDSSGVVCNDENSAGYNALGYNTDSACNKHYSGKVFTNTVMIDGKGYAWDENGVGNTVVGMPTHDGRSTMTGNVGNGYAKITLIEKLDTYNITYDLDGGTLNNKKKTYSTFDETFTLGTPTKEGHTFLGWIGGKNAYPSPNFKHYQYSYSIPTHEVNNDKTIIEYDKNNVYVTAIQTHSSWEGALSDSIKLRPNTNYSLNLTIDGDGSSPRVGVYNYSNDEFEINQYFTNQKGEVNIKFKTDSTGAIRILFGMGPSNENTKLSFKNIYLGEDSELSSYEPVNDLPDKNLVIEKGSTGNRYYKAVWSSEILCKRATYLHSTTCSWAYEDNKACRGAGYSIGDNITYGSLVDGTLKSGDAFDCDVNGDGKYDGDLERFYYMGNLDSNSEYAVLIYSNLIKGGIKATTYSHIKWGTSNANNLGPTIAINDLPTTSQWSNVSLYNNNRQIYSENKIMTTTAGNNVIFDYSGRSARIPTYDEIKIACDNNISKLYQYCEYILEGTSYDLGVGTENYGFWLENPAATSNEKVFEIDSHWRSFSSAYTVDSTHFMVKPVIEVPKSKLRY